MVELNLTKTLLTLHFPLMQTSLFFGSSLHRVPSSTFPFGYTTLPFLQYKSHGFLSTNEEESDCTSYFRECRTSVALSCLKMNIHLVILIVSKQTDGMPWKSTIYIQDIWHIPLAKPFYVSSYPSLTKVLESLFEE